MKYSQHFKRMKVEKGIPALNHNQHSRCFIIVAIEYHIDQMQKLGLNSPSFFKCIQKQNSAIKLITKDLDPEFLFLELVELSR